MGLGDTTKFSEKKVDDKLIGVILASATSAHSAGNVQEWEFIVVKDKEVKKRLGEAAFHQKFVELAPVVIVVCANLGKIAPKYFERGEKLYAIQDTAFASLLIAIAARALGLGCYLVQAFDEEEVRSILELPDDVRPMMIIPLGYPAEEPEIKEKIPFENLTWINKYGKKYEFERMPILDYLRKFLRKKEKKLELEEF